MGTRRCFNVTDFTKKPRIFFFFALGEIPVKSNTFFCEEK